MGDGKTGSTQVVQTSEILKRTKINSVYIFVTTHKKKPNQCSASYKNSIKIISGQGNTHDNIFSISVIEKIYRWILIKKFCSKLKEENIEVI